LGGTGGGGRLDDPRNPPPLLADSTAATGADCVPAAGDEGGDDVDAVGSDAMEAARVMVGCCPEPLGTIVDADLPLPGDGAAE
jgi:hypothetical protein